MRILSGGIVRDRDDSCNNAALRAACQQRPPRRTGRDCSKNSARKTTAQPYDRRMITAAVRYGARHAVNVRHAAINPD